MRNAAASRLCLEPFSETSVIRVSRECLSELGRNPDLAIVFASSDYAPSLCDFLELIQLHAHATLIIGGSASGLVGSGQEAEAGTGFSLQLLSLPDTKVTAFPFSEAQADDYTAEEWRELLGSAADSEAWLFLGNPLKIAAEPWLNTFSSAVHHAPVLGGLLSGGRGGEDIFVMHNRTQIDAGILVALKGGVRLHSIVSQGCRPIGEPHAITGASENVVSTIGSISAYDRLSESFESLDPEEKARAAGNLFVGLALNEYVDEFKTGDFLVRNLIGVDSSSGNMELAAYPRIGQTLQFQLRDRHSAHDDLQQILKKAARKKVRPFAALSFLCGGRGSGLFGAPHHDAVCVREQFGAIPNIGLFCNGEVGPIGGRNSVHGYTAVIGLLE
jgi:small ligand-binding sensory domain FIST